MEQTPQWSQSPDRGRVTTCKPGSDRPSAGVTLGPVPPAAGAGSRLARMLAAQRGLWVGARPPSSSSLVPPPALLGPLEDELPEMKEEALPQRCARCRAELQVLASSDREWGEGPKCSGSPDARSRGRPLPLPAAAALATAAAGSSGAQLVPGHRAGALRWLGQGGQGAGQSRPRGGAAGTGA